jgi:hypothetical protein
MALLISNIIIGYRWGWYFWITTSVAFFFAFNLKTDRASPKAFRKQLLELDLPESSLMLVVVVMFFVALRYTSVGNSWGTPRAIGLLVGFGTTTLIFMGQQWHKAGDSFISLDIF